LHESEAFICKAFKGEAIVHYTEIALINVEKDSLLQHNLKEVLNAGARAKDLVKVKSEKFDLVITDMTMPKMSGDDLAREILKIRTNIPIILCTGYSKKISEGKAEALGVRALVMKPIVAEQLAKIVRQVLDEG
jgi:CheY-like chemotaxis protein